MDHDIGAGAQQPYTQMGVLGKCSNNQTQDPSHWYFSIRACADMAAVTCSEWSETQEVVIASIAVRSGYVHTDGLRSPVAETDASGTVTARMRYEPYVKTLSPPANSQRVRKLSPDSPGRNCHVRVM